MKRQGTIFCCDAPACAMKYVGSDDGSNVQGFHGTVTEVTPGGSITVEYYSCCMDHLSAAVDHALTEAWRK